MRPSTVGLSLCLLGAMPALAGTNGYECTVVEERGLGDDGRLAPPLKPIAAGKRFAVDRRTGVLVDAENALGLANGATIAVLAYGNKANSFVATYTAPIVEAGMSAVLLRVEEFSPSAEKPFVLMNGGRIYSGRCR